MVQRHDTNQNTSGTQQPAGGQQTFTAQQPASNGFQARTPNRSLGNQTWTGGNDTKLNELAANLVEMIKATPGASAEHSRIVVIDKSKSNYEESFVVVAREEGNSVYVVPLFIQQNFRKKVRETVDSRSPLLTNYPTRGVMEGNVIAYDVPVVPSDIGLDVDFKKVLRQELNATGIFKVQEDDDIKRAGSITIPTTFDISTESALGELLYHADNQIQTALAVHDQDYLNFRTVDEMKGTPVNIYIQPNEFGTHEDMLSLPIHSPLRIEISQHVTQNNMSLRDESGELGYIGAYVDALYIDQGAQQAIQQQAMVAAQNNPMNMELAHQATLAGTRKYRQVLKLTKLDRYVGGNSPQDLLFNLAALPTLQEQNFIHNAWCLPDNPRNRNPLLDIGAFGYETALTDKKDNQGNAVKERIDTNNPAFGQTEQRDMINRLFYPDIIPAIDVMQSGPLQLFNNFFSQDHVDSTILMQAAVDLTKGAVLNHFDNVDNIVFGSSGLTPWGIYTDRNGNVKDIREVFNYLGWLNHVTKGKKPDLESAQREMERWSFAVENSQNNTPEMTRFMEKMEMMNELTEGTFKLLDKMETRYINPEFIKAIRLALESQGIQFVNTSNQQNHQIQAVRGAQFVPHNLGSMATNTITQSNTGWSNGVAGQFGQGNRGYL